VPGMHRITNRQSLITNLEGFKTRLAAPIAV
jgi:hypothetical protein